MNLFFQDKKQGLMPRLPKDIEYGNLHKTYKNTFFDILKTKNKEIAKGLNKLIFNNLEENRLPDESTE